MTQTQTPIFDASAPQTAVNIRRTFWHRFCANKPALVAMIVSVLLFVVGMGHWALYSAGVYWPYDPITPNPPAMLQPPSAEHWLGTDDLGRDVFSRILLATHVSLLIGLIAVSIAVAVGTLLGSIAGFCGGAVDNVIMRFVDMMMCIPTFFLVLTVAAIVSHPSIWYIMPVIGLTGWMGASRLVRAEFLTLREMEYVLAARALGAGRMRIIFRHILPNALPPVFVSAVLGVSGAILTEASLSYLGFGVQPPDPSWGNIIADGRQYILSAWWLITFPSLAIFITTLAFYITGEGMRIALDPKETKQI